MSSRAPRSLAKRSMIATHVRRAGLRGVPLRAHACILRNMDRILCSGDRELHLHPQRGRALPQLSPYHRALLPCGDGARALVAARNGRWPSCHLCRSRRSRSWRFSSTACSWRCSGNGFVQGYAKYLLFNFVLGMVPLVLLATGLVSQPALSIASGVVSGLLLVLLLVLTRKQLFSEMRRALPSLMQRGKRASEKLRALMEALLGT